MGAVVHPYGVKVHPGIITANSSCYCKLRM